MFLDRQWQVLIKQLENEAKIGKTETEMSILYSFIIVKFKSPLNLGEIRVHMHISMNQFFYILFPFLDPIKACFV